MGSPPQVRGKPFLSLSLGDTCRITPAGAGKTPTFLHCITVLQDHPRRCGENFFCVLVGVIWRGSPPQVRGKPRRPRQCRSRRRITPAGAGKTAISIRGIIPAPDHPRRCGENYAVSMYSLFPLGSPPQVRGKPGLLKKSSLGRRITPAGAGKTCSELAVRYGVADHPRRCGENLFSSPKIPVQSRITPAGAGKTIIHITAGRNKRDHPRRCGENLSDDMK